LICSIVFLLPFSQQIVASDEFHGLCAPSPSIQPISLIPLTKTALPDWTLRQTELTQNRLKDANFSATDTTFFPVYSPEGKLESIVFGMNDKDNFWILAHLAAVLPQNVYQLDDSLLSSTQATKVCLGWALEHYRFNSYRTITKKSENLAKLIWPEQADKNWVIQHYEGTALIRDLVNTPAEDMGPHDLIKVARATADHFSASYTTIIGKDLLSQNYPMIYAVGKGAKQRPRLFDMEWHGPNAKKSLVLVGKGVCFDSGGLNIKTGDYMRDMKKDMAGAAHVLALAKMIMMAQLPINLRLLIPAVENAVSRDSYRPGDILKSRKGLTVEIGNTDAEGRLILADALTEGSSTNPDLIIDFATLTGAARMAVGPLIQPFFCNSMDIAQKIKKSGDAEQEAVWELPLFQPYKSDLKSAVADLNNMSSSSYNGAISAALFLEYFVQENVPWLHFDIFAWNKSSTPGKPEGGEATGLRTVFNFISGAFLES
jgi:leucyl aminopeptidase